MTESRRPKTRAQRASKECCPSALPGGMTCHPPFWASFHSSLTFPGSRERRPSVNELVRYLLENMYLDFQGEISLEQVRAMLREDGSREARGLLEKLTQEN